jgi:hypothetical protein
MNHRNLARLPALPVGRRTSIARTKSIHYFEFSLKLRILHNAFCVTHFV